LTKPHDVETGVLSCLRGADGKGIQTQHQDEIFMFLLGESTTESKVSGQAGQKQGSRRVKGRADKEDGTASRR